MIDRWAHIDPAARAPYNRTTALSNEQLAQLWEMRKRGAKLRECAQEFGVHIATVCRYITAHRKKILEKNMADRLTRNSR